MEISPGGVDRRSLAAAGVTVVLWASAFIAIRSAGERFSPGALTLGRLVAGSVVLLAILVVRREGWPARAAWPGIVVAGVLWFASYMTLLNWGEQHVDAGTASMIVNVGPILIALLGGWLLKEGFPRRVLAGIAVSFGGAVVVGLSLSGGGSSSIVGLVACVLAAVSYSVAMVLQKPALRHASAVQVTTFSCLVGTVACLPFVGQLVAETASAPVSDTLNVIYLGVFPTGLAFTTWAYALHRTTAAKLGATTYVVPAVVVLMSWLALGEVPGWLTLVGGLVCLAGVAISRRRPRPRLSPPSTDVPPVATRPSR
jgi:drug/metabolite transporter (DMT)-like permease